MFRKIYINTILLTDFRCFVWFEMLQLHFALLLKIVDWAQCFDTQKINGDT